MMKEIIFLDLSGSTAYAPKVDMLIDTLKLIVESSKATKIYVYGVGMKKVALLTPTQYKWITEADANVVINKLQFTIKDVDSHQGTLWTYAKNYGIIKKIIPKKLLTNSRITILSDSDIKLGDTKKQIENFLFGKCGTLHGINYYDIDDNLARLLYKKLKSLQVVTKTVSVKPKPKKREIEPTITK